jgi:hypothetical protein
MIRMTMEKMRVETLKMKMRIRMENRMKKKMMKKKRTKKKRMKKKRTKKKRMKKKRTKKKRMKKKCWTIFHWGCCTGTRRKKAR